MTISVPGLVSKAEVQAFIKKGCLCQWNIHVDRYELWNVRIDCPVHGVNRIKDATSGKEYPIVRDELKYESLHPEGSQAYESAKEAARIKNCTCDNWDIKKGCPVHDKPVNLWPGEKKEVEEFLKPFSEIFSYNREFAGLLNDMARTHIKKNHDYASDDNHYSNFEYAYQVSKGFQGVDAVFATMIGIKMARICELKKGKTPNNESIEDSFKDMCVYAALWSSYNAERSKLDAKRAELEKKWEESNEKRARDTKAEG